MIASSSRGAAAPSSPTSRRQRSRASAPHRRDLHPARGGSLIGAWAMSGTLIAMVYYGLQLLSPNYFYVTAT